MKNKKTKKTSIEKLRERLHPLSFSSSIKGKQPPFDLEDFKQKAKEAKKTFKEDENLIRPCPTY